MFAQLIIQYTKVVKMADGHVFNYKDYKRSAPMPVEDILKLYGKWMSSHQNWSIRPVDFNVDF